jgi:hypothetical protein
VNVLSGLLEPTHGEAFLFGQSIRKDVAQLRDRMGSCPQHDLLWDELSGELLRLLWCNCGSPYTFFEGVFPRESVTRVCDTAVVAVSACSVQPHAAARAVQGCAAK